MPKERHSNPHNGGRDQYKRHVDGDISVRGQVEVHSPPDLAQADSADREHQKANRNKTYVVSVLTLIGVIVYAGLTYWLGSMTRESIDNNGKQFQIDQRPYVWRLQHGTADNVTIVKGEPMKFNIYWVNSGKSPAVKGTIVGEIFVGTTAEEDANAWFHKLGDGSLQLSPDKMHSEVVPPGIPSDPTKPFGGYSTVETRQPLKQEEVDYIMTIDDSIAIVARYQYSDMFGNVYWSDMCMSRFKNGSYPNCRTHNAIH